MGLIRICTAQSGAVYVYAESNSTADLHSPGLGLYKWEGSFKTLSKYLRISSDTKVMARYISHG